MAKHGTVLIVDDEPTNVQMLAAMLEADYEVLMATDGQRGFDIAMSRKPDLILLDIVMPDIDGYKICARIKAQESVRHIPVIFLTALSDMAEEAHGLELGAIDYLTKPFSPSLVRVRVRNHIELKQMRERYGAEAPPS